MSDDWVLEASEEEIERVRELLRPRDDDSQWTRFVMAQIKSDDEGQPYYTFHVVPTSE